MRLHLKTPNKGGEVWLAAALLAGVMGLTFNVKTFCLTAGVKDNRHTRSALKEMVRAGYLASHRRLYDDGHYRTEYFAQRTPSLWGL